MMMHDDVIMMVVVTVLYIFTLWSQTDIWSFGVTAAYIADYDSARKSGSAEKVSWITWQI